MADPSDTPRNRHWSKQRRPDSHCGRPLYDRESTTKLHSVRVMNTKQTLSTCLRSLFVHFYECWFALRPTSLRSRIYDQTRLSASYEHQTNSFYLSTPIIRSFLRMPIRIAADLLRMLIRIAADLFTIALFRGNSWAPSILMIGKSTG